MFYNHCRVVQDVQDLQVLARRDAGGVSFRCGLWGRRLRRNDAGLHSHRRVRATTAHLWAI